MKHAILSASSSYRWLNCPPSARLEQNFPDRAGVSAEEGTFAHKYAEMCLCKHFGTASAKGFDLYLTNAKKSQWFTKSLQDYAEEYIAMIIEKAESGKGEVFLEQKLDFSDWVPGGFGSGDAVIIYADRIEVCDLKYGKNVPVSAENNSQLRLYGLGAYSAFSFMDFKEVQMTICQPRNGGISTEVMPLQDLLAWGESIKPIAKQAFEGKGDTACGDWCLFCKAKARCRALADENMMSQKELKDPRLLSDSEFAQVLAKADAVKNYVTKLKEYAYDEALHGREWPGWKLVEGRANRAYSNEETVASILLKHYEAADIYKPKSLIGITAMESLLGKKDFKALIGAYIIRPEGKPVLVPEGDARPALNAAENYFEKLD